MMSNTWTEISGRRMGAAHVLPVRIYYEDTDTGGVVYHANYLKHVKSVETAAAVDEMFRCASKPDRHQPTQPLHEAFMVKALLRL